MYIYFKYIIEIQIIIVTIVDAWDVIYLMSLNICN